MEIPCEKITVKNIEDLAFRLNIISFAADMDILRMPSDREVFEGLKELKNDFSEVAEFLSGLVSIDVLPDTISRTTEKHFDDISFQGNILLFYVRGEIEKMSMTDGILSEKQKSAFCTILNRINEFIVFTQKATEASAYATIADMLFSINNDMLIEVDLLGDKGGAMRFLTNEFKSLADNVMQCV